MERKNATIIARVIMKIMKLRDELETVVKKLKNIEVSREDNVTSNCTNTHKKSLKKKLLKLQ